MKFKNKESFLTMTIVSLFSVLLCSLAFADEIHKKDGSILKGKIIENIPNEGYKIELADSSIFVVPNDDVKKVIFSSTTESKNASEDVFKKHHIGIHGGYYKALSDDLKFKELDVTNAGFGVFEYRYSFTPILDGVISSRAWFGSDTLFGIQIDVTASFFGGGIRIHSGTDKVQPYFQMVAYVANEQIETTSDYNISADETGVGIGLSVGLDIQVSDLISIPLEAAFIGTSGDERMDDLSGIGFSVGVNFNF